jgi:hypothetical protein
MKFLSWTDGICVQLQGGPSSGLPGQPTPTGSSTPIGMPGGAGVPHPTGASQPPMTQLSQLNMGPQVNSAAGRSKRPDPRNLPNPTKVQQPKRKLIYNVAQTDQPAPPPPAHFKYIVSERGSFRVDSAHAHGTQLMYHL